MARPRRRPVGKSFALLAMAVGAAGVAIGAYVAWSAAASLVGP